MELQYYGANCIKLTTKKTNLVFDDNLASLGGKSIMKEGDKLLFTDVNTEVPAGFFGLSSPGEYEVADISIIGIAAQRHIDEPDIKQGVIYKLSIDDITLVVTGNIHPDLSSEQLEAIGMIDILIVPVGGHGYTVDPVGALQIIKKIEPKVVIPVHYDVPGLNFPVPQMSLEQALKEMAMEPARTETKLKLKVSELPEQTQLWVLER